MNPLSTFQTLFAPPRDLIFIVASGWIGLTLSERRMSRYRVNIDSLSNLLFLFAVVFVAGGRSLYALENLSIFSQSPGSIFSLNTALFDQWGGLVIALIAALAYGQRARLPLWSSLDALTPIFAAVAIGVALSHLASGTAFGKEANLPWAIDQWGALRHPTQIYETAASILTLILILAPKANAKPGYEFLLFAALASASRLIVEGFRGDSTLIFGGFRAAQIIAWIILFIALAGLEYQHRLTSP